jgi:RNA polymerase sigma factor (sigma-70 family)
MEPFCQMNPDSHAAFPPTRWSVVLATRDGGDARAGEKALGELCRIYWQPIYSFARRRGASPADAEDLAQGFFMRLLEEGLFAKADASAGRLRSFLLGAFQRYQREEWRKTMAAKRGGGQSPLSFDADDPEESFQAEDPSAESPERIFERHCARALLEAAMKRLAAEQASIGKDRAFALLRPLLSPSEDGDEGGTHEEIATALGLTVEASRAAVYRLRKRFREILRETVADTLIQPTPESVDEELMALRAALS